MLPKAKKDLKKTFAKTIIKRETNVKIDAAPLGFLHEKTGASRGSISVFVIIKGWEKRITNCLWSY